MFKIKALSLALFALVIVLGTLLAVHHFSNAYAATTDTIIQHSTNPSEDINIGEIALGKIHKKLNITSSDFDYTAPFSTGTLQKNSGFWKTFDHVLNGRSMTYKIVGTFHINDNLLGVNKNDIHFDQTSHVLSLTLPKPEVVVHINDNKTKVDDFSGFFSAGYTAEEEVRIHGEAENASEIKIEHNKKDMKEAEDDLRTDLSAFLKNIPTVKDVHIYFKQ